MNSLSAQIIDLQVGGLVERQRERLSAEFPTIDEGKMRSMAFVTLVVAAYCDVPEEEALDCVVEGSNDLGIDAMHYREPVDGEMAVTLVQCKYSRKLDGNKSFPENALLKMVGATSAILDPSRVLMANPRLRARAEEVRSFVRDGVIPKVELVGANNGTPWTDQANANLKDRLEKWKGQVRATPLGADDLVAMLRSDDPVDATLKLTGKAHVDELQYRRALVGRMPVQELAALTKASGRTLFEGNVRHYLGLSGNRVNESMAETLRDPEERANFFLYNNGITFTCTNFRHNALASQDWQVQAEGLQIVNGGQTAHTVERVYSESATDLAGADVLVRVYEVGQGDESMVAAITRATNSQNPVMLADLRANDRIQRDLVHAVSGLGYTYHPKRGGQRAPRRGFTSEFVAEAVLAVWRRRPHHARFNRRSHFGPLYETIFGNGLDAAQAIMAALILREAERHRRRASVNTPDFRPYASRFVAMLMGGYLLRDVGIELAGLDHGNFEEAKSTLSDMVGAYIERAEADIEAAVQLLLHGRERTLQRLSATFRRPDLVEVLADVSAADRGTG